MQVLFELDGRSEIERIVQALTCVRRPHLQRACIFDVRKRLVMVGMTIPFSLHFEYVCHVRVEMVAGVCPSCCSGRKIGMSKFSTTPISHKVPHVQVS
jgi:hypothetical protein